MWDQQGAGRAPVDAPNMLWLIQRDFLEGKSVQQSVIEALARVPNPSRDPDIAQARPCHSPLLLNLACLKL